MKHFFGKLETTSWYGNFCRAIVTLGWLPFFLGQPMIHGGTITTETLGWAGLVTGGYCSLELVRSSMAPWYKAPALIGCIIYGVAVGMGLYFALPFVPRLFAS